MPVPVAAFLACVLGASPAASAAPVPPELRAVAESFVAAQNAHDLEAVAGLLRDSPDFLWITRGTPVWGRTEALARFRTLHAGTWHLEPEWDGLRAVVVDAHVAELFVPIAFTIGAPSQPAEPARFLMNMVLVQEGAGWKVAALLPVPVPPPSK